MTLVTFAPATVEGPWCSRLGGRRRWIDDLPWAELPAEADAGARWIWTQTAYSEYAAAASFSAISTALAAAGAPIDFIALAGDFVVDEIVHVELAARLAAAHGGGVRLEVDLERLVRPSVASEPRMRAVELVVRASCVGEALSVPMLDLSRRRTPSRLVSEALRRVLQDEVPHASFGRWVLEWADGWLDAQQRAYLGRIAGAATRAFAPAFGLGVHADDSDNDAEPVMKAAFAKAVRERVVRPLEAFGIEIPCVDLEAVAANE